MITRPGRGYYVYILFDLLGFPRYVGKGKGARWLDHEKPKTQARNKRSNPFLYRIVQDAKAARRELPKIKVCEGLTEQEAFATEVALIAAIGRADRGVGPLVNLTDGGDGAGHQQTPETRARMSATRTGRRPSEETRARLRAAKAGHGLGRKQSKETVAKRITALTGRKRPKEVVAKVRAALAGRKFSEEHVAKLRQAWALRRQKYGSSGGNENNGAKAGRKLSEESLAKIRLGVKQSWILRRQIQKEK